MHSREDGSRSLAVIAARLEKLHSPVDAIVSADDNYLSHGGGVSADLWRAAGPELESFVALAKPRLALGDVFASTAGRLRARELLHAVTIDFDANRRIGREVGALYARVFERARERGHDLLALPLLGTGAAGLPLPQSVRALQSALASLPEGGPPQRVVLAVPDVEERTLVQSELESGTRRERTAETAFEAAIVDLITRTGFRELREAWRHYSRTQEWNEKRIGLALVLDGLVSLSDRQRAPRLQRLADEVRLVRNSLAHTGPRRSAASGNELELPLQLAKGLLEHEPAKQLGLVPSNKPRKERSRTPLFDAEMACEVRREPPLEAVEPSPSASGQAAEQSEMVAEPCTPAPATRPAAPVGADKGGTAPVRALHSFLLRTLPEQQMARLDRLLEEKGYRGATEYRLLEYLVRTDPLELVGELFTLFDLKELLDSQFSIKAGPDWGLRHLSARLLQELGFTCPRKPIGLGHAQAAIKQAQAQVLRGDALGARGAVAHVAAHLEYLCLVMLRFIMHAAYDQAPEPLFRQWGWLAGDQQLGQAGIGRLFNLVRKLDRRIREEDPPRLRVIAKELHGRRLFPERLGGIAELRNSFVHYRKAATSGGASVLQLAEEFLKRAGNFVDYLDAPKTRIFPSVVAVEAVNFDRWGRRVVSVVDDTGCPDTVFTEEDIRPGQIYFLHALSNPLRVDPILVPAGELTGPAEET